MKRFVGFVCAGLGLAMLIFIQGCRRDNGDSPAADDSVFSRPTDLGSADGFTMNFRIGGSAGRTISIPTGIPSGNGFAVAARVRLADTADPDRFSERSFDRGPDGKIEHHWVDGRGNQWLLIRHRDPDTQREWIALERVDQQTGEIEEHLLARDKTIFVHDLLHAPSGEDFLLFRGNLLSNYGQSMALQPLSGSLPATLEPMVLPFLGEPNLWIKYCGFSPAGTMILIWSHGQQWSGGSSWIYGTRIARSDDNGRSWSEPRNLPALPELEVPLTYLLRHDGAETMHLFVATQHYANAEGRTDQYVLKSLLHFSSADNGITWLHTPVTLPIVPAGAFFRGIAIDAVGTIDIVWSTDRTVYLVRSSDRGATWSSWLPLNLPGDWLEDDCRMALSAEGDVYLCIRACHPGAESSKNILFSYTRFAGK